ncbi:MAG TPA: aminoacyl-tRNA hydrolase [Candidatus Omnitrophota bacterium]|nr:aminoacyl-tRNA hydrolase [Candidatus Omnitrophota bacterium]
MLRDYLLVGLGNPGKEYTWTRHNAGFLIARHFADLFHMDFVRSSKYHGLLAQGVVDEKKVYLLLPTTYMNVSGVAVKAFVTEKKIAHENILIVCDDFQLAFGELRFRAKGSAGGHNGLSSVVEQLGTSEISRLRLGIGSPKSKDQVTDFVLSEFKASEKKQLIKIIDRAANGCRSFLVSGISHTMAEFNKKTKKEETIQ